MSGIDVNTMITELRVHIGNITDQELSDPAALLLLNRSWWEFQNKTPLREQEKTVEFDISSASNFFEMPEPFEAIRLITVIDPDTEEQFVLERMSQEFFNENFIDNVDLRARPTHYLREDQGFKVYPHPDRVYRVKMLRSITLSDLVADGELIVPDFWHEVILFGGVYRGFLRFNDHIRGEFFRAQQADIMNTAMPTEGQEEQDSQLAGLRIVGYDRENL